MKSPTTGEGLGFAKKASVPLLKNDEST